MMRFRGAVVCDFEYEVTPGNLPNVLCMVAYELDENFQYVRTTRLWRGDFGAAPPFDVGADTLFIAYSAWAELTCFMQLGWQFPVHIFDLHTAYLATSNILLPYNPDEERKKQQKRLPDACHAYGVEGWERIDKGTIAQDIGEGRWQDHGREAVLEYCEEDVRASAELFRRMLHGAQPRLEPANLDLVLHWSNYSAKAIARIQARGMPIDTDLWNKVQENKHVVVAHLLRQLDPSHGSETPIYDPEGGWSNRRFEAYLAANGVTAWPRLDSGELQIDSDAFNMMCHVPGMESLHALRDSLGVIVKAKLPIGRDGRNRPSLFPFCTATGRNAHAKSLYNAHAGMRSFMRFDPDTIAVYLDYRTQEVGVAAAHSGDETLKAAYATGDVYYALARVVGATHDPDPVHWKKHNEAQRQQMKSLQLAINYGMGVSSLARGLNRHPVVAAAVIERYKRTYPKFWEWRDDMVMRALLDRKILPCFSWPLRISTSPNTRTLYNFPMQSGGAEMTRLAAWGMCEAGLVPSMLIHDAVLFEARNEDEVELAKEIMRKAGRTVCDGFQIDVGTDQRLERGARYRDKRPVAQKMWATMMRALQEVGAIPEGELP